MRRYQSDCGFWNHFDSLLCLFWWVVGLKIWCFHISMSSILTLNFKHYRLIILLIYAPFAEVTPPYIGNLPSFSHFVLQTRRCLSIFFFSQYQLLGSVNFLHSLSAFYFIYFIDFYSHLYCFLPSTYIWFNGLFLKFWMQLHTLVISNLILVKW